MTIKNRVLDYFLGIGHPKDYISLKENLLGTEEKNHKYYYKKLFLNELGYLKMNFNTALTISESLFSVFSVSSMIYNENYNPKNLLIGLCILEGIRNSTKITEYLAKKSLIKKRDETLDELFNPSKEIMNHYNLDKEN